MAPTLDLDDDDIFRAAVHEGRERLVTDAIAGLREILNPSRLQAGAEVHASRPTVYKRFESDPTPSPAPTWATYRDFVAADHGPHPDVAGRAVLAAATGACDGRWAGWSTALDAIAESFAADDSPRARLQAALRANLDHQFRSPGMPAGWVAHAAALTASARWEGRRPGPRDLAVGRAILAERRQLYAQITEGVRLFLEVAMDELHLRPEPGIDVDTIAQLLHCLFDGAVLRAALDPDELDLDLVAEAMYRLAESFTHRGAFADPRRPAEGHESFDRLVATARTCWQGRDDLTPVTAVAAAAGIDAAEAVALFPSEVELADSVLWLLVGVDPSHRGQDRVRPVILAGTLRRLQTVADGHPGTVRAALGRDDPAFFDELRAALARAVRKLNPNADADEAAAQLVGAAIRGAAGRPALDALDRLLALGIT